MRVNQSNSTPVQNAEVSGANKNAKTAAASGAKKSEKPDSPSSASGSGSAEGAQATISSKAKEMAKVKEAASNAPDVREEKIAELRKKIAEGRYKVDAEAIADKMVDDHLRADIG